MRLLSTPISGVILVEADPVVDERGLFARIYDEDLFREAGLPTSWQQSNVSWNPRLGTLRGMHYQTGPHAEIEAGAVYSGQNLSMSQSTCARHQDHSCSGGASSSRPMHAMPSIYPRVALTDF